jgi:hypothetical protein
MTMKLPIEEYRSKTASDFERRVMNKKITERDLTKEVERKFGKVDFINFDLNPESTENTISWGYSAELENGETVMGWVTVGLRNRIDHLLVDLYVQGELA